MSVVEIAAVSKRYESAVALADLSITVADGEFFGLLGPSGSGKTTLLRAIAGFVLPDSGRIRIDGKDVQLVPVHRRDIAMVFQNYALFPHMSVFDNVAFGLAVRRVGAADTAARVGRMLDLVRLGGLDRRRPRQLSGGQQQRVALARALITEPRVLLLDEPLGALDKRLRQQMQIELRQIQRKVGITTVFVTHDQEEALTLSDRIAILNEGRLVQIGSPSEVYERPVNAFAANFLGDANFFAGRAAGTVDGLARVRLPDGVELLTADPPPAEGEAVLLAVRPEKLLLAASSAPPPDAATRWNRLEGRVEQVVYSGSSITYMVAAGGANVTVFAQNRAARSFGIGDWVSLHWSPENSVAVRP